MPTSPRPVPCLVGPTASGKSDVGIALARRLGAEVVACDAMTVYRGVAVLTAKPSPPPDVPHHLLDIVDPWAPYSAGRFLEDADAAVAAAAARGRTALLVGGTVLYLKTFLKGLGPRVGRDEALRAALEAVARDEGPAAVHARLAAVDPDRAAALHPHDLRRVVRALEIAAATGRPASAARGEWAAPDRRPAVVVALVRAPEDLRARIEARARAMLDGGVAAEVAALDAAPRPPSRELAQALGLADVRAFLRGTLSREACLERLVRATWRFSRRQATFLKQVPATAVAVAPDEPADAVAARVEVQLRAAGVG